MHGAANVRGAANDAVDQLVDELMLRLSHLAQLTPDLVDDPAAKAGPLRRTAEGTVAALLPPGPQAEAVARMVMTALWGVWGDSRAITWWRTPLGALLAARTHRPSSPVDLLSC